MHITVLLVDDFVPFRSYLRVLLKIASALEIVGEAGDGAEAIQKSEQLKPQIVLLDLSMPGMSGIEAAKEIRKVSPSSKIIFLTDERSKEVAQHALKSGAEGYVVKLYAGSELLDAITDVIDGRSYLSQHLT